MSDDGHNGVGSTPNHRAGCYQGADWYASIDRGVAPLERQGSVDALAESLVASPGHLLPDLQKMLHKRVPPFPSMVSPGKEHLGWGEGVGDVTLTVLAAPAPLPSVLPGGPDGLSGGVAPSTGGSLEETRADDPGQELEATWYGLEDGYGIDADKLWTASGERFDPAGFTAASNQYDLGTVLVVTYDGKSVVVRTNDRCGACVLDMSRAAFEQLAPLSRGRITVNVEVLE